MRDRRGAADDRDGARGGRLVRSRARSRSTPATRSPAAIAKARAGRYRERSFRALPPALARKILRAATATTVVAAARRCARRITSWSVVNLMAPEDVAAVRTVADRVLPQRVHLFFRRRRSSRSSSSSRDAMPIARLPVRRRLGVAARASPNAFALEEIERRVRLREAVSSRGVMTSVVRVLIVDDSAYVRKVVPQMLSRSPFLEVVGTARDGREALELVGELQPDVVTCDLIMPELDGVGFVTRADGAHGRCRSSIVSVASESGELVLDRARRRRGRFRAEADGAGHRTAARDRATS